MTTVIALLLALVAPDVQAIRPAPRPLAPPPDAPRPEDGTTAPDGYAPAPQWRGQTRAPAPSARSPYAVTTFAEGFNGAFCGTIPKSNPFAERAGARPEIYALGFRDIQGVAIDPGTGHLWTSEHDHRWLLCRAGVMPAFQAIDVQGMPVKAFAAARGLSASNAGV